MAQKHVSTLTILGTSLAQSLVGRAEVSIAVLGTLTLMMLHFQQQVSADCSFIGSCVIASWPL